MKPLACVLALLLGSVAASADPAPRTLRVMTYNVEFDNPDLAATLDAIAAGDADVVVLQEITQRWQDALGKRFAKTYPQQQFHLHARGPGGLAILSKLPIASRESTDSPTPGWFPADRMIVRAPFGDVQIVNVHLRPAIDQGSWLRGYLTTPPLRLAEIKAHWKPADGKLPTIVAGDFNEDATGSAVQFLEAQGLSLAPASGPPTWHLVSSAGGKPTELMSSDLDHVLVRGLVARAGKVLDAGTSDHRPVVVTLAPPDAKP